MICGRLRASDPRSAVNARMGATTVFTAVCVAAMLGACSASVSSPVPTASSDRPRSPAACLVGGWQVNPAAFAVSARDVMPGTEVGTLTGDVSLGFTDTQMTATFNGALKAVASGTADAPTAVLVDMRGASTATYAATSSTFALSDGNSAIVLTASTTTGGVTKEQTDVTRYEPLTNFSSGTVAYSCNGSSLVLTNQSGMVLTATRTS